MLNFCTLFDENYLDKGLVLYKSLERVTTDFTLYILCMSDRCYEILTDLKWKHIHPVSLSEFENEDLLKVKPTRSAGEYCWTCGPFFTIYVINTFNAQYCSYIDADIAFYDDPQVIIEEMASRNASVSIIGHRFNKDVAYEQEVKVGKYCVECNTFKNDENGRELLNTWARQCLEYCSADGDGIHWADQKYMDNWIDDYPYTIELENLGAGVAPWNIKQYKLISSNSNDVRLSCKGKECRLLFFHFQGLRYIDRCHANIGVMEQHNLESTLVYLLYDKYLSEVNYYKNILRDKYDLDIFLKFHPAKKICQMTLNEKIKFYITLLFNKLLGGNIIFLYKIYNYKNIRKIKKWNYKSDE